jgi:hypothetical protein
MLVSTWTGVPSQSSQSSASSESVPASSASSPPLSSASSLIATAAVKRKAKKTEVQAEQQLQSIIKQHEVDFYHPKMRRLVKFAASCADPKLCESFSQGGSYTSVVVGEVSLSGVDDGRFTDIRAMLEAKIRSVMQRQHRHKEDPVMFHCGQVCPPLVDFQRSYGSGYCILTCLWEWYFIVCFKPVGATKPVLLYTKLLLDPSDRGSREELLAQLVAFFQHAASDPWGKVAGAADGAAHAASSTDPPADPSPDPPPDPSPDPPPDPQGQVRATSRRSQRDRGSKTSAMQAGGKKQAALFEEMLAAREYVYQRKKVCAWSLLPEDVLNVCVGTVGTTHTHLSSWNS